MTVYQIVQVRLIGSADGPMFIICRDCNSAMSFLNGKAGLEFIHRHLGHDTRLTPHN